MSVARKARGERVKRWEEQLMEGSKGQGDQEMLIDLDMDGDMIDMEGHDQRQVTGEEIDSSQDADVKLAPMNGINLEMELDERRKRRANLILVGGMEAIGEKDVEAMIKEVTGQEMIVKFRKELGRGKRLYEIGKDEDKEEIMRWRKDFAPYNAVWLKDWTPRQSQVAKCMRNLEMKAKSSGKRVWKYNDGIVIDSVKWKWNEKVGKAVNDGEWM